MQEIIWIKNSQGKQLAARLDLPLGEKPSRFAVFAHCFTCSGKVAAARNISMALVAKGFAVMRFDFTGLGMSEGELAESHFSANIQDLSAVIEYIKSQHGNVELLVGHSLGGAAAIVAAALHPEVKAVASIGAPAHIGHAIRHFEDKVQEIEQNGSAEVSIGGRNFVIGQDFVDDFRQADVLGSVAQLRKALLILHSPIDRIVGIDNAQSIYHAAKHPKSFISLDQADHLLLDEKDSRYAGDVIGSWAERYIPRPEIEALDTEGEQVLARLNLLEDNFTTFIQTGRHTIIADEPTTFGGKDLGPGPYQLLASGLAACTAMTLQLYAKQKGWPLEQVDVFVSHSKQHATDMAGGAKVDLLQKQLKFKGDLTEDQKSRLGQIASRCPVHLSLQKTMEITTSLKD